MEPEWLQQFLGATPGERIRMATEPSHEREIRANLGDDVFAAYARLAAGLDQGHLAADSPPNLVFVPGVMGSLLASQGRGGVWWIDWRTASHLDDLALKADGSDDIDPSYRVASFAVDITYEPFFAAALGTDDMGHIACHYDWRKPLAASTHRLRHDIARARDENGGDPVHVVAHSMGGLLIRETLRQHPDLWSDIGRIVFIGTPHYGSPSIAWYLKNHLKGFDLMAVLGLYLSRATFRSLWGVLSLLPAPRGVYPGTRSGDDQQWSGGNGDTYVHPSANFDMYNADAWKLGLGPAEQTHLQAVLDGAASFHRTLYDWHMGLDQEYRDRMAVIAGVGYRTLFRLVYTKGFLWDSMNKISSRRVGDPHREGDGRVPLASAELEHVGATRYVRAEHGGMASVAAISSDVFRFLRGDDMELPDTPAGALSRHLAADDTDRQAPALGLAVPADASGDDPGYLEFDDPDQTAIGELKAQVDAGRISAFRCIRIL